MKKKAEKLDPKTEKVRRKVRALTGRKTYYSLDTEFGVLTVDDAAKEPAAPGPSLDNAPGPLDQP